MAGGEFKLPDIGEGTAEAELVAWRVQIGDAVVEDDLLCEVMTDKATVEVTSPFTGTVTSITGAPGDLLPVGSVVMTFDLADDRKDSSAPPEAYSLEGTSIQAERPASQFSHAPQGALAGEFEDPSAAVPDAGQFRASPAVRKRATSLGLDLLEVEGSGPGGRIEHADLDLILRSGAPANDLRIADELSARLPARPNEGVEEIPVIGLRRRIAERLQDTKRRIPHFSYIEEIDVTRLEELRERMNAERGDKPKLTVLPFLIRAIACALPEFPQLNSLYDDSAGIIRRYSSFHAGIATQTPAGLVVTVVRNAESRTLRDLASEIARLALLAREGRAAQAELSGSTFTISSLGPMGGLATTPVINSPEVAIVGVNKIVERPIVQDGRVEAAKMMNLSSSFDHRIVDGWDAASFIQRLKALLEMPIALLA